MSQQYPNHLMRDFSIEIEIHQPYKRQHEHPMTLSNCLKHVRSRIVRIPVPIDKLHTMQHLLSPFAQSYCPDALRPLSAGRLLLVDRMINCESHQVWPATVRRTQFSVVKIKDQIKIKPNKGGRKKETGKKKTETRMREEQKIDIVVNEYYIVSVVFYVCTIRRKKVHASKLTECQHEIDYKRFNNQASDQHNQPTKFKFNFMLINFHSRPNCPKHVQH